MLSIPSAVKIYLCKQPVDMRRSFDGLATLTQTIIGHDPLSGHIFVFRNKRGHLLKILYWDRDGLAIWYKRLEKGVFSWPDKLEDSGLLDHRRFTMMLEGVRVSSFNLKKRFYLQK